MKKITLITLALFFFKVSSSQIPSSYGISGGAAPHTNEEVISRVLFGSGNIANPFSWQPYLDANGVPIPGGTDLTNPNSTGNNVLPCRGYSDHTIGNSDPNDGNPNDIQHAAIVERGQVYSLQIVGQRCSGGGWGVPANTQRGVQVWIDFDQNGFFDVSEKLINLQFQGVQTTGWTPTFNVTNVLIPNTAVTGTTFMRIVYSRIGVVPFFSWFQMAPQGVYNYGETHDYTIQINGLIDAVNTTNISCSGSSDGQIEIIPNPTAPVVLEYSITGMNGPWQSSNIFSNLTPGVYDVWVRDPATGELEEYMGNSITLTEPSPLSFSSNITSSYNGSDISCFGASDGEITISSIGGTAPYDYSIDNGMTFSIAQPATFISNGLSAISYDLVVQDANGCVAPAVSITLSEPQPLSLTAIVSSDYNGEDISCVGASDGEVTLSGSGGTTPYQFDFNNTGYVPNNIFSNLAEGNYDVTIQDANSCSLVVSPAITLNDPQPLVFGSASVISNYNGSDISCFGVSDGEIEITASGGATGSYTYLLDNVSYGSGSSPFMIPSLSDGTYDVTIQDANGCLTVPSPVTLTEPAELIISSSSPSNLISCNGDSDGEITIVAAGGTGTYQFSIDNGSNYFSSSVFPNLTAGIYPTFVIDENDCEAGPINVTLTEPQPLLVSSAVVTSDYNGMQTSCFGVNDGEITIVAQGGTPNYSYSVSGGASFSTTNVIGSLSSGNYDIVVEDINGCLSPTGSTVTITSPNQITTSASVTSNYNWEQISCNGGSDGVITITTSGGTGSVYTYIFPAANYSGASPYDVVGLSAGNYPISVVDVNGCTEVIPALTINEPTILSLTTGQLDAGCSGASDGSAWVNASGGTPSYSYLWSNNDITSNTTGLSAGPYNVVVTDANGCFEQADIIILQPIISTISQDVTCFGASNGSIETIITNGSGSYTFLWDDPLAQTNSIATGLAPGTYSVIATDPFGCELYASDSLIQPAELIVNILSSTLCSPTDISTIEVEVDGGIMPYSFLWNTLETQPQIYGVDGLYSIDVTDANLCLTNQTATVLPFSPISTSFYTEPASCIDNNDAIIQASVVGGYPPYEYYWSNGENNATIYTPSGDYSLLVTDDEGCQETFSASVGANQGTCLEVYSAFTPNGDENNDYWHIENIELYPDALVEVFNRWGNRVFASKKYINAWDGGFTGNFKGEPLPSATYYYVITLNNDEEPYKGALTIVR